VSGVDGRLEGRSDPVDLGGREGVEMRKDGGGDEVPERFRGKRSERLLEESSGDGSSER